MSRVGIIAALIGAAALFGAGWTAQSWRLSGQIEALKHGQTQAQLN